jgi:hypothetical protein
MNPIFRWSGQYYGFVANGYLFDAESNLRGWVGSDGTVWRSDGQFLGDLVGGEYVLHQQSAPRARRAKRVLPSAPIDSPVRPPDRVARAPRVGYVDGLNECS